MPPFTKRRVSLEDAVPQPRRIRAASIDRFGGVAVLVLAVALGGFLRFSNLGEREMSADEGASWAAASAPSVSQVLQLQPRLNPGKFAVHEVALHGWIRLFGDGLVAMRSLSAVAGTLAVAAVFFLSQELFALGHGVIPKANEDVFHENAKTLSPSPAAFAAFLLAVNLVFVKYAQEARMYSVALLCGLIQIEFFLRGIRRPTPASFFFTALFTALAIASTFTMLLTLAPELFWLAYLVRSSGRAIYRRAAFAGLALIGGLLLLIPPAFTYLGVRAQAPALLAYAWASLPPLWAPISMFNKAVGSVAFPVVLGLALWGIASAWRAEPGMVVFVLLWMLLPPILVLAASYLIRPAFVERYMLSSFVPFFLLAALGIWNVRGFGARSALMALVTLLALGHIYSYRRYAHDVQWREAVDAATRTAGRTIAVAPPYAADVVRYYLRDSHSNWSVARGIANSATVAIVADSGISSVEAARIAAAYPRLLMRLRGVIVRVHQVLCEVTMEEHSNDIGRLKSEQKRDWDAAAAGWKKWWPVLERGAQPVSDRLVELARVGPSARVLDVATGSGEPAVTAARRAAPGGLVIAVDQSPGMLAIARERAESLRITNIEFRESDGEALTILDHDFDAVLCRWGLMFMPDLTRALSGFRERLAPGGHIAVSVWSTADKVPMISIGADIVRKLANLPPPSPGALDPLRLGDSSILGSALDQSGFKEIKMERMPVTFEFDSAEDFTKMREDVASAFRGLLARQSPEMRRQIIAAVTDAARQFAQSDGKVRTTNETILFAAHS
jgi:SAM-dependent methyltransferase